MMMIFILHPQSEEETPAEPLPAHIPLSNQNRAYQGSIHCLARDGLRETARKQSALYAVCRAWASCGLHSSWSFDIHEGVAVSVFETCISAMEVGFKILGPILVSSLNAQGLSIRHEAFSANPFHAH